MALYSLLLNGRKVVLDASLKISMLFFFFVEWLQGTLYHNKEKKKKVRRSAAKENFP